jgi:hypothetical protein
VRRIVIVIQTPFQGAFQLTSSEGAQESSIHFPHRSRAPFDCGGCRSDKAGSVQLQQLWAPRDLVPAVVNSFQTSIKQGGLPLQTMLSQKRDSGFYSKNSAHKENSDTNGFGWRRHPWPLLYCINLFGPIEDFLNRRNIHVYLSPNAHHR